mgnify:CR=1 FL=1
MGSVLTSSAFLWLPVALPPDENRNRGHHIVRPEPDSQSRIDPQRLGRDFNVADAGTKDGLDWLELTPKQDENAGFQNARLGFDSNGLARMQILDALGQRTDIRFSGWKRNPSFSAKTFRFTPPKGADVVGAQ